MVGRSLPRRVVVYGVTGSGKSTLARRISEAMGIPYRSADDEIGWLPGWEERPEAEQREIAAAIAATDEWVLDTAYGRWRDLIFPRAELIVALDYPRWVSLGRLLRRTVHRAATKTPVCNGNTESWRLMVSKDSIIAWHFRSFATKRARIEAWQRDPDMPPMIRLRSPAESEQWLADLPVDG